LPDAHVEAPTAISVILAGVLLKMGTYGMMRISLPIFPGATQDFAFGIAVFGVINILYGAYCAMAQSDLKKLVAYSSVSHMGYVLLGMAALTPQGMTGAALQMFNHGTITAMMFLLVGVIYDRAHHRDIDGFGGIGAVTPVYTGVAMLAFFASMGLPGLSGFVSEVMVFLGAFQAYKVLTFLAALGIILTAGYLLWMIKRVFLGALNEKYAALPEINGRELFTLVPIGLIVLFLGIYPLPVLDLMSNSTARLVQLVTGF
jgi:NADH-quinone oxidoreductase subunit M